MADERLRVHIVWLPVLGSDDREGAERQAAGIEDDRVTHYWSGDRAMGEAFRDAIPELREGNVLAWDIYMMFGRGDAWSEPAPMPDAWMHQLGALGMDDERRLDGDELRRLVEQALDE